MSRTIVPVLLFVGACSGDPAVELDPPEVVVMASCDDDLCEQRVLEAVTMSGEPTSWDWVLPDGSTAKGQLISTRKVDDLDVYEVVATDDDGGSHRSLSAVVSLEVKLAGGGGGKPVDDKDITIVIVPMGASCDRIPVVNIGGCITSPASPIGLHIDAAAIDDVSFSTTSLLYDSTQTTKRAVWRIGPDEGHASGTSFSDYYTALLPAPPVQDHFTAYFQGVYDGTSTVFASHGSFPSKTFSAQQIGVTCDKDGNITRLERRSVEPSTLDFDGDGYPQWEDCDETDPNVHEDC